MKLAYQRFLAAALLSALAFLPSTFAQVGSGWSNSDPQQFVHTQKHNTSSSSDAYDSSPTMSRSAWRSQDRAHNHELEGMNGSHWPAEYRYDFETDAEEFALYGTTSTTGNRCEVRIADNYGPGQKRQLEGYVTFFSPLDAQSMLQIWGSETGAAQLMLRGFTTLDNLSGGVFAVERERAGGDNVGYLGNAYGQEIKVNVVHLQNSNAGANDGKIQIYANGVLLEEFTDTEDPTNTSPTTTNYMKYGIYQTITAGHENPRVVWKNVRLYSGGATPGTTAQTINNLPTTLTKNIGDAAFSPGATATSNLPVSYRSSNLAVARIVNNQVQLVGPGTAIIWANQGGSGTYAPAPSKQLTLTVQQPTGSVPALYEAAYHSNLTTATPRISAGTFATAQDNLTVAFWIRANALGNMGPVDKLPTSSAGGGGWTVKLRADGAIWFRLGNETTPTDLRLGAGQYVANTWVHVAATYDGTTLRGYINGIIPTGGSVTAAGLDITGATELSIGRPSVAATTNIFSGDLRDVRFYDRALSAAEIALLAIRPQWLMNGPRDFTGTATDFMSGGTTPGSATSLTVAFFMTADQLASMQPVDKLPLSSGGGWSVKLRSNNQLWFRIGNEATNTTTVADNAYIVGDKVHVVCTFSGGIARTYLDGVEIPAATVSNITQSISNTTVDLRLAVPQAAATTNFFDGRLERVRVFHQALSAAQIQLLADGF